VGLIYPREAVWNRRPEAVDSFRAIGHALVDDHVLFDVIWDQKMTPARLARYPVIVAPGIEWISEKQRAVLEAHVRKGGAVLRLNEPKAVLENLGRHSLSRFVAPWTLRVAGYSQPGRRILHFVNYNRDEKKGATIKGPGGECPAAVEGVEVDLRLPGRPPVRYVRVLSPDEVALAKVTCTHQDGRLLFVLPRVEVYTLVEIRFT
jgi:hypothetical protein